VGGAGALMDLTLGYLVDQSRTGSVVLGAAEGGAEEPGLMGGQDYLKKHWFAATIV